MNDHPSVRTVSQLAEALGEIARNYWWSWAPDGPSLFRDLDPDLWESSRHNPRRVVEDTPHFRLTHVATDPVFASRVDHLARRFAAYRAAERTWASANLPGVTDDAPVAYFCAEFGVHESLPIYAGGLGILAGDHLKSASDLGIPLVGVGLLYREGYFRQSVSPEGEQLDYFLTQDFDRMPIARVAGEDGEQLAVRVPLPGRDLAAAVWRADVGRVRLYLLDADVEENAPEDRAVTARLYGGDRETRMKQELLLGVGGVRALRALGLRPGVYHLNEGHSAFLTLELARELVAAGASFDRARAEVRRLSVFTTHTPVPAGHDEFPEEMVERYLGWLRGALGLSPDEFMALGAANEEAAFDHIIETIEGAAEPDGAYHLGEREERAAARAAGAPIPRHLGVTPLAIRMCRATNGVSLKHGEVSREMWKGLFPGSPVDRVPVAHVTNGVHARTWIAPLLWALYDRHFGEDWPEHTRHRDFWERVAAIPDGELWAAHQTLKERLVAYARHRVAQLRIARGDAPARVAAAYELFEPRALTLGFARRFASYKRGDLLFYDPDRLAEIVGDPDRPVQVVFSGKAHPNDGEGKRVLRRVVEMSQDPRFARWIVFLEDYDINIARHLVRGVDVWVNTPRRPLEASGTSGEKVALNGGLNLSVLDGWWLEGYSGANGWAVGGTEAGLPHEEEDRRDAASLYALLADEIVPLYYDQDERGVPHAWVEMMKRSIATLTPVYNTDRMVAEYATRFYAAGGAPAPG